METKLFYKSRARAWEEALPLGNGRIGAMVFGNLKTERIALNEDSLWSGYPKDLNKKDAGKYLKPLQDAIFNGDRKEAKRLANEDFHGHWSEAYLPFGDLIIEYKGSKTRGVTRTLDLSTGVATAENGDVCESVFVSHPAQLLVVNIKSKKGVTAKIKLFSLLKHKCRTEEDTLIIEGDAPEICMPPYYNTGNVFDYGSGAMKFAGAVKVLGNATFEEDYISVENQHDITLLVSLATNYIDFKTTPSGNPLDKAMAHFENIKLYEELLKEHIADHSALFGRVEVDFGSERAEVPTNKRLKQFKKGADDNNLIALLFQYGRYLTIACSRPGTNAMTLQGIFNPHLRAPWSSSYTVNINTEMNYWCTDICNLSECFDPFFEQVKKMCINGEVTAKDYYNCSGSVAHHNSDIWGASYPAGDPIGKTNSETYACWQAALPWMLNEVFEHYRYTKDELLFRDMKPYFKKVLDFYKDFLIEHDGKLVTCPTISPENSYLDKNGNKAALTYMPTMDVGILQEFFMNCKEFGFEVPEIPDIPIGSDGRINEWSEEFKETEIHHRHASHLYCIYPSAVPQSEELREAAKKSLLTRGFDGTGWALGWKVCLWARLDDAQNALTLIKNQLRPINPRGIRKPGGGSYPNMFDAHPPFQIDGNFGVAAGIAEMLTRGAIPKEWSGYAKGLKLKDGTELDIKFQNGKVINR